jgi:hypothetical protein
VRNWESGAVRIPYAAFKLMRVIRGGKLLGAEWKDYYIRGDRLITPEGHDFKAGEMAWWSLVVRRAREFSASMHEVRELRFALAELKQRAWPAQEPSGLVLAMPLDNDPTVCVASQPSPTRAERQAAGSDPLPAIEDPSRLDGWTEASFASVGQAPAIAQVLEKQEDSHESLSLTIPVHLAILKRTKRPPPSKRLAAALGGVL